MPHVGCMRYVIYLVGIVITICCSVQPDLAVSSCEETPYRLDSAIFAFETGIKLKGIASL